MSLTLKLVVLVAVAVAEGIAILILAKRVPEKQRGLLVPVLSLSSVVLVALVAYLLFYFAG